MKKNKRRNKFIPLLMALFIFLSSFAAMEPAEASASSKYITVEAFIKYLVSEMKLTLGKTDQPYIDAVMKHGILKEGDFVSLTKNLTRGDCMVLLNRADEYLNKDMLDEKLVQTAIEKRISDITRADENKRTDIAKAYLKGFMKGYSNGAYCPNRNMKLASKISKSAALNCLKLLKDKSLRAKISPDGQLIRTTNLPKSANNYPYILASFPNEYYDWKFYYECISDTQYNVNTGKYEKYEYKNLVDYATPKDLNKISAISPDIIDKNIENWVEKAQMHMESLFNLDYRTVNKEWIDKILSASHTFGYWGIEDQTRTRLESFIERAKNNETIIESEEIIGDRSSMYYFDGFLYLRFYVKYRINSSKMNFEKENYYEKNSIFYTSFPVSLTDFEIGEWKECLFEVALTNYKDGEENNQGVYRAIIDEPFFISRKIK